MRIVSWLTGTESGNEQAGRTPLGSFGYQLYPLSIVFNQHDAEPQMLELEVSGLACLR
jgi:hypothetical protein